MNNLNSNQIKANTLLVTPDPNLPIIDQISKVTITYLPDKNVLKNANFEMFSGTFAKRIYAKKDGTFCYDMNDPEFAAVSVFLSLQQQMQLYLDLGMTCPKQPMFVVVNDSLVIDNAHFDLQRYEIHIGVGSVQLVKDMVFDLSIANHEFGHAAVFLQTAGNNPTGRLGEAIDEAVADVLGALTMDYLSRIWYAKKLGKSFTVADLINDKRIIGKYASPPFGIRCLKNNQRWPQDLVGECHADSLIISGALSDLLIAIATSGVYLEKQIKLFARLILLALALMPNHRVDFFDMLHALIKADNQICSGKYRLLIEKCFADHGIVLDTIPNFNRNSLPSKLVLAG